jgi:hypothetical protein
MALHRSRSVPLRSELGHERLCAPLKIWSTLPLRADPAGWAAIGRFVPILLQKSLLRAARPPRSEAKALILPATRLGAAALTRNWR